MKRVVQWSAALLLMLGAGCVNVDYIGQTFDPIPEGKPVEFFGERSQIPVGKYRIIGRGEISTTRRLDHYDIREILIDEARKRGADAVVTVSVKHIRRGVYPREPAGSEYDTAPALNSGNVKADGSPLDVTVESAVTVKGEAHSRSELEIRVLFLKTREDLEQQLARRGRELDRLVKQPDPATGTPEEKSKTEKKK